MLVDAVNHPLWCGTTVRRTVLDAVEACLAGPNELAQRVAHGSWTGLESPANQAGERSVVRLTKRGEQMGDFDQRQLLTNAMPLIAVILMASGIVVKTLPLESKRPVDSERAKISHAGRQDVEARLWQDPFVAMRDVEARTPRGRCEAAIGDVEHHPQTLTKTLEHIRDRRGETVTVMPVFVPGGPYFQDGESRLRTRYAAVMALLRTGWEPRDEDKLGFVWTFESCVDAPWARRIPELLPYEWFSRDKGRPGEEQRESLLILWIDEDAVTSRPLDGMTRLIELVGRGGVRCPAERLSDATLRGFELVRDLHARKLDAGKLCVRGSQDMVGQDPVGLPRAVVLGPWTSTTLFGLVHELARLPAAGGDRAPAGGKGLRFYTSSATARIDDEALARIACEQKSNQQDTGPSVDCKARTTELGRRFEQQVLRLNATDDKLTEDLVKELKLRLADATPMRGVLARLQRRSALCDDTMVIVAEADTSYARAFKAEFDRTRDFDCGEEGRPRIEQVSYLRGLDGIVPGARSAPSNTGPAQRKPGSATQDLLLEQASLERADGPSQFDYLRRLAAGLDDLDRLERDAGRNGVTAIGVLGNDAYDKILVLDALRDRFPQAVFFAADLDARLLGAGSIRSTRNLVVASGYGLALRPELQGSTPPFRDNYQVGSYLSTLVALDPVASGLTTEELQPWFASARRYEIGRTRPVNLLPPDRDLSASGSCSWPDPSRDPLPGPAACQSIHAETDWRGFDPMPRAPVAVALLAMLIAAAGLAFVISRPARALMRGTWSAVTPAGAGSLAATSALLVAGLYAIHRNVESSFGEPFAWFEGVSIWPTEIIGMAILALTVALLVFGRRQLHRNLDQVAGEFGLATLTGREAAPRPEPRGGLWQRARWLWRLDGAETAAADPWGEYLERMRLRPSVARIAFTTLLFFVFGVALMSLDWPNSPHRGAWAAWFNHGLQLVLIAAVMALLFAALDASAMATRFLANLYPLPPGPGRSIPIAKGHGADYPLSAEALDLWTRFRLAVRLSAAVNRYIYLPFIALLLLVPARSRVFDAWDFSLPYAILLVISLLLAVRCAISLRKEAARLRSHVLSEMEGEAHRLELRARLGKAPEPADAGPGPDAPPGLQAELLRRIAGEIRAVRDGPFRPIAQEPVVRGILLVLGGTGGITTAEFLFLSRG